MSSFLRLENGTVLLLIRVQPKSSRSGPIGEHNGMLRWGVHAAPVDGAANEEVIKSVAAYFSLAKSLVKIRRGEKGREKQVELGNLNEEEARAILREKGGLP